MVIQWFPGHMNQTRQKLPGLMQQCDVVIELLDARLPHASSNPLLDEARRGVVGKGPQGSPGDVPCITLLTKDDLADPAVTARWRDHFHNRRGVKTLAVNLTDRKSIKNLPKIIRRLAPPKRAEKNQPVQVAIVGIPNVGKSTLVNAMRGKSVARTGDEPAVTKGHQAVKLDTTGSGIVLIDTPGILWPKFEDPDVGMALALSGAIKDTATDDDILGPAAAAFLLRRYPDALKERYKLKELPDVEDANASIQLLDTIGRKRGCLVAGGEVDLSRAGQLLLREMRGGKLGRVSLETP